MFKSGDGPSVVSQLEECIKDIHNWMNANMLKLNDETELLVIRSKRLSKHTPEITTLQVGEERAPAESSARNIGSLLDNKLNMTEHVKSVCKAVYTCMHFCNLSQIRWYLTDEATSTLVHSFITSKLDNLNALLYGLPDTKINKLQWIQNHAAKLVAQKKKHDYVTPILISLHWPPLQFRIRYKILLLTYKCLHGEAPQYLLSLLQEYTPSRILWFLEQLLLRQ